MNNYYFSKRHKVISLTHPDKSYNQFSSEVEEIKADLLNIGQFSGDRIMNDFANTNQITFEVTSACNLKCKYCTYGELYCKHESRLGQNLSFRKAKNLIDYYLTLRNSPLYESFDVPFTLGFYGGEPLLNFNLITEIISYIEDKIPNLSFSMTTNGTLLDKYIDYLTEKKFSLLISLDGNEKNNCYRIYPDQRPSFEKVFNNLKEIKESFSDYFNTQVSFNSVLNNENSISEIHTFFKKEFNKMPKISEISSVGIREDKKNEFLKVFQNIDQSLRFAKDSTQIIEDMQFNSPESRSLIDFLFKFSGNYFKNYNELFFDQNDRNVLPTGTCAPFSRKIFLLVNGKLLPCERIGQLFEYGRVTEEKVELDFNRIAKMQNEYYNRMKNKCSKCARLETCISCILQINNIENNPQCDLFLLQKDFLNNYINLHISILERKPHLFKEIWEKVQIE